MNQQPLDYCEDGGMQQQPICIHGNKQQECARCYAKGSALVLKFSPPLQGQPIRVGTVSSEKEKLKLRFNWHYQAWQMWGFIKGPALPTWRWITVETEWVQFVLHHNRGEVLVEETVGCNEEVYLQPIEHGRFRPHG